MRDRGLFNEVGLKRGRGRGEGERGRGSFSRQPLSFVYGDLGEILFLMVVAGGID